MSKIIVSGTSLTLKSALTLGQIEMLKKYRPNSLVLMGGDDGKDKVFAIDTTTGDGGIGTYGISFGRESFDEERKAVVTMPIPTGIGDVKEWIADKIAAPKQMLDKLEEGLFAVMDAVQAEREAFMNGIEIAE